MTQASRAIAEQGIVGLTPLEYMLGIMRDENADASRRDDMAKAAGPYIHARLSSVEANVTGKLTLGSMLDAIDA